MHTLAIIHKKRGLASAISAATFALTASGVCAEQQDQAEQQPRLEEIVVTANVSSKAMTKLEASYGITTFNTEDLEKVAAQSTASLLGEVPGFFTEGGTAGEASNNAYVRGIPSAGGFKFLPLLIDGLPMYEEPEIGFMNNDVLVRTDLMTQSVEAVRGGPASIMYSHALGGAANFITRTGGDEFEGAIKMEVGDWGHVRNDFFLSGPINNNLKYAIGGYHRVSDGIRDPGYTANKGGQLRGNLTWLSDDETTAAELHFHSLNDNTIFYQNIPFSIPAVGRDPTRENPVTVTDIQSIGVDLGTGTMASNGFRTGVLVTDKGPMDFDLSDGISADFDTFTVKFRKDFGGGWRIENNMRQMSGESGFNALFTGSPVNFDQFLANRERNDVGNRAFSDAGSCSLDSVYLSYYNVDANNCGENLNAENLTEFIDNYANYNQFAMRYADSGEILSPDDSPMVALNGLWFAKVDADMFVNDFKIHKDIEFFGDHTFTAGLYYSNYDLDTDFRIAEMVSEVKESGQLLDVVAVSSTGSKVGPSVSDYGIYRHGAALLDVSDKHSTHAVYLHDDWQATDSLRINVGARWQKLTIDSNFAKVDNGRDLTPNNIEPGSSLDTLADNNVISRTGRTVVSTNTFEELGWTLGANYLITDDIGIFGRVSDAFRMPRSEVLWDDRRAADPVQRILQAESGVKIMGDTYSGYLTLFWNEFQAVGNFHEYTNINDPGCQSPDAEGPPIIEQCEIVEGISRQGTENYGVELEVSWTPTIVPGLSLDATLTWQEPTFSGGDAPIVEPIQEQDGDGNFITTGYEIINSAINGNTPQRFPKLMANLRPSYSLYDLTGIDATIYGAAQYVGDRFASDRNENIYEEYWNIQAGTLINITEELTLQLHASNLLDKATLTEGTPVDENNLTADGQRNLLLGRPFMGRTVKASITYRF